VITSGIRAKNEIPTASMADISFLLFIFFVSTTIFRMETGLPITLPRAETVVSQKRETVVRIWVDRTGQISIQDKLVGIAQVRDIMSKILKENPALIVAFNADVRTPNREISAVIEELKKANAVRLSFTAAKQSDAGGG
jgi:biopolymer transport protein ExbD